VFPLGDVDVTVAFNFIVQSTGASVMDIGILNLHDQLHTVDPTAFIFAQVHDAVYVECATERVERVSDLVTRCMSCEVKFRDDVDWMPLPAKAHDGADWLEAA
jgi:DNA polymerase I-like protein with 3'-5' exonuclease and polymerase domains